MILKLRGVPDTHLYNGIVFNPFTFTIGTRGNCEPIVCAMILWILICLIKGNLLQAAVWYGVVVHLRVYPIIYALPIIIFLDPRCFQPHKKPILTDWIARISKSSHQLSNSKTTYLQCTLEFLTSMITWRRISFELISGSTFFILTGFCFRLYG